MKQLEIFYVDGTTSKGSLNDWESFRAEGIDYIIVDNVKICCASIYWLYPENDHHSVGWGSVGYDHNPIQEILVFEDHQELRYVDYMPDLSHKAIKLGWFWPGEERPVRIYG